jgi:hypothetical protein
VAAMGNLVLLGHIHLVLMLWMSYLMVMMSLILAQQSYEIHILV